MKTQQEIKILFLSSWRKDDPLMHNYLLPNVRIIQKLIGENNVVWIQTWEKENTIQSSGNSEEQNINWIPFHHKKFGPIALLIYFNQFLKLIRFCRKEKITHLHGFAPVANGMALLLSYFCKAKIIADSWEPHAESMIETGTWKKNSFAFKLLFFLEKKTTEKASYLIAASNGMRNYAKDKWNLEPKNVLHRPACVDLNLFNPDHFNKAELKSKYNLQKKIICICSSQLGGMYLKEETISFFKAGAEIFGDRFQAILLTKNDPQEVASLCGQQNFPLHQIIVKQVAPIEVPEFLALSDFAFNPQKPVPSKRYGTPVKDGEYWAMGLPLVILPNISDDSEIVEKNGGGVILKDPRYESMLQAHRDMQLLLDNEKLLFEIRKIAEQFRNYSIAESAYQIIYGEKN